MCACVYLFEWEFVCVRMLSARSSEKAYFTLHKEYIFLRPLNVPNTENQSVNNLFFYHSNRCFYSLIDCYRINFQLFYYLNGEKCNSKWWIEIVLVVMVMLMVVLDTWCKNKTRKSIDNWKDTCVCK